MSDTVQYRLVEGNEGNGVDNVVAFFPGKSQPVQQANSAHPHWSSIVNGLANGFDVYDLFDVQGGVVKSLTAESERVTFDGHDIRFDGDVQEGPLAEHLIRCIESGVQDYAPIVRFWEKVATNPDERSREQLFTWLRSHAFTITESGDILGYKGVYDRDGKLLSSHSGTAWVDGVEFANQQIPNEVGTEVTMPRSKVRNDPSTHCSHGLHVGEWSYASSFASVVLEVHVNPRDVVSIPNDSHCQKMRTCRYKVVKIRTNKSDKPIETQVQDDWTNDVSYRSV